jgi:hypothetical protein
MNSVGSRPSRYTRNCLEQLGRITENLDRHNQFPGRYSKRESLKLPSLYRYCYADQLCAADIVRISVARWTVTESAPEQEPLCVCSYLLTYLRTELSPSWEAANCAAIQIIPSNFKEPEGSSPCSQDPSTVPYTEPVRSSPYHHILSLLRSILILSTNLRLGLPSGLFPFVFPTNILYAFLVFPIRATYTKLNTILILIRPCATHSKSARFWCFFFLLYFTTCFCVAALHQVYKYV